MTRRGIAAVLRPLLVGLLISVSAPAVGADAPCITDGQGTCFQAQAFAGQSMSIREYDAILTALERASDASTAPIAASPSGPTGGPDEEMASPSLSN